MTRPRGRPTAKRGRAAGQSLVVAALGMTVLCGALALGLDVGLTSQRYQALVGAAESAADAGAHTVYGRQLGENSASDAEVWRVLTENLAMDGLTVANAPGAAPSDPCAARYSFGQVGLAAAYLDASNDIIRSGGDPVVVGNAPGGAIPAGAWGLKITALSACQPAAFGAIMGHRYYPISVSAAAGRPLQGPTSTPAAFAAEGRVITLDPSGVKSLDVSGSGASLSASEIDVSSANNNALWVDSSGSVTAANVYVKGTAKAIQGGTIAGNLVISYSGSIADPFAALPAPAVPSISCPGSACPSGTNFSGSGYYDLLPGYYIGSFTIPSTANVCLAPGNYYLDGTVTVAGGANIGPYGAAGCPPSTGTDPGILLYFHSGSLVLNGDLTALSAPSSGPYAGLLYWQADSTATTLNAAFSGGAWYEPAGQLSLGVDASLAAPAVVADDIGLSAGSSMTVAANPSPTATPSPPAPTDTPLPTATATPLPPVVQ